MQAIEFIRFLQKAISKFELNIQVGSWHYLGASRNNTHPIPETIDLETTQPFWFKKGDLVYGLYLHQRNDRSTPYLGVDSQHATSVSTGNKIINYALTKHNYKVSQDNDNVILCETNFMNVKGAKGSLEVKTMLEACGMPPDGVISRFPIGQPEGEKIISDILEWAEIRENVRMRFLEQAQNEVHTTTSNSFLSMKNQPLNQILYGPPGTGKTYQTIELAVRIINPEFPFFSDRDRLKEEYDRLVEEKQIVFTTFHQSMTYEDFVEGIKPIIAEESEQGMSYGIEDGIFKKICKRASPIMGNFQEVLEKFKKEIWEEKGGKIVTIKAKGTTFDVLYKGGTTFSVQPKASIKENPWYPVNIDRIEDVFFNDDFSKAYNHTYIREIINFLQTNRNLRKGTQNSYVAKKYVLIIDEINRGNVSAIFGELITLLESNKRKGQAEAIELVLPYSKEVFAVPPNLYLIGTMNTADRSVEALDTALRRRFYFQEIMPQPALLAQHIQVGGTEISLQELLATINQRIEVILDRDHLIGHSYLMAVKDAQQLKSVFSDNIIPLLQEYFYGDYSKIEMVLGKGFCKQKNSNISFAQGEYDASFFIEKSLYELVNLDKLEEDAFEKALHALLNKP